jgi:hypothetical protein
MTLFTAWTAANPLSPTLDPTSPEDSKAFRHHITEAVRLLTLTKAE